MRPVRTEPLIPAGPRRWLAALVWLAGAAATAQAAPSPSLADAPPDCGLLWRVTAQLDAVPRQLQVEIAFDAGGRSSTTLRLPGGWAGVTETADGRVGRPAIIAEPRLMPVAGAPALRRVQHGPAEQVRLQWRLVPASDGMQPSGVREAAQWLAFSGQSVLPMPMEIDERAPPNACIALAGLASGGRWVSSHGAADTPEDWLRVAAGAAPLAVRVHQALLAGGALQTHSALADGTPLTVALPPDGPWRFNADTLHQAAARAITAQRRYWGTGTTPPVTAGRGDDILPWLLLLMPADAGQTGGTAWHRALALNAAPGMDVPGAGFDLLMTQALARAWVAERFGPLAHAGRGDESQRAWFSEGVADFLSHRALLRQGLWTPNDYAAALNHSIDAHLLASGPEAVPATNPLALAAWRGEWLALRWHAALLAAGRPGLEAHLQRLLVPAAQARREGPISAPLATHRLLAVLRPALGDTALADLKRHVEQAEPVDFGPATLGPCFVGRWHRVGRWQLGFDPASLKTGVLQGVEPGSNAETAGLRNGLLLRGHAWAPGDATQAVWLRLQDGSAPPVELSYLPAGLPLRELPRYDSVAQALQRPDCQAWLGPAAQAAQTVQTVQTAQGAGLSTSRDLGGAAALQGGRSAEVPAAPRTGVKAKPKTGSKAKAGKPNTTSKAKAPTPNKLKPKPSPKPNPNTATKSAAPRP